MADHAVRFSHLLIRIDEGGMFKAISKWFGHRASGIGHRASGIGHRASGIGHPGVRGFSFVRCLDCFGRAIGSPKPWRGI
jgi:hypothetical protein